MKNEITAKFKDSPLGPIPQDWEVKRLGEIGEPVMCKRVLKSQTSDSGDVPFYKIGTFGDKADAYISRSLYEEFKAHYPYPRKGDILVSAAGTIGRTVVFDGNDAYFQDSNIVWIDHDESKVLNIFLYLCYKNMRWQSEDGGIISRLYNANLKAQTIPLPPLPEQRRIAEALGEMDRLIESLDAQIVKKRRIAQGLAHDLLGTGNGEQGTGNGECGMRNEPIRRLPGFKGEWVKHSFDEVFALLRNNTYSREFLCDESSNAFDIHYGDILIRYGVIVDVLREHLPCLKEGVKPNKDYLQDGDIVFADTAEDEMVGKAIEIRGLKGAKVVAGLHTMPCRPRQGAFAPEFLGYYLNSDSYHKQLLPLITGSKVSALSRANFASTTLFVPPTLAEQRAIAEVLAAADEEISALEAKKGKYEQIRSGMMRDLLSGRVRI